MAIKDIRSNILVKQALNHRFTADGAQQSAIIDTANFDKGIMFSFAVPDYTDGSYAVTIDEGDDSGLSDASAVASGNLIGSLPTLSAVTTDNATLSTFGVHSNKRYLRVTVTASSVTTGAEVHCNVSLGGELLPVQ